MLDRSCNLLPVATKLPLAAHSFMCFLPICRHLRNNNGGVCVHRRSKKGHASLSRNHGVCSANSHRRFQHDCSTRNAHTLSFVVSTGWLILVQNQAISMLYADGKLSTNQTYPSIKGLGLTLRVPEWWGNGKRMARARRSVCNHLPLGLSKNGCHHGKQEQRGLLMGACDQTVSGLLPFHVFLNQLVSCG